MFKLLINLFKKGSILSIGKIFQGSLQFLLLPIYTRLLQPEHLGIIDMLTIFHSVLTILILIGIRQGFTRNYLLKKDNISDHDYKINQKHILSTALLFLIFWGILIIGFLIPNSKSISIFLLNDEVYSNFIVLSIFTAYGSVLINIYEAYYLNNQKIKTYVFLTTFQLTLNLLFILYFLLVLDKKVEGVIIANSIINILFGIFLSLWLLYKNGIYFKVIWIKKMLRYGAPAMVGILILFLFDIIDRLFIQYYFDVYDLGIYSIARKISKIQTMAFVAPFLGIWAPSLYSIANEKNHKSIFAKLLPLLIFIFSFSSLTISVFSEELIWIFATEQYYIGSTLVIWMCMAQTIFVGGSILTAAMGITGKSEIGTGINLIVVIFGLIMNYLLVPSYGMLGASIATFITFLSQFVFFYIGFQRIYYIPYQIIDSLAIVLGTFISYYLIIFSFDYALNFYVGFLIKVLGVIIYFSIFMFFITKSIKLKLLFEKLIKSVR